MAPQQTWRAWITDADGNRQERTGTGEMPDDVREQMRSGKFAPETPKGDAAVDGDAKAPVAAESAATPPAAAPAVAPAPAVAAPVVAAPVAAPVAEPVAAPVAAAAPAPASAQAPSAAETTSNGFVNVAAAADTAPNPMASAAAIAAPKPAGGTAAGGQNTTMIVLGAGLIAALTVLVVAGLLVYRRRLVRKDAALKKSMNASSGSPRTAMSARDANDAADMFLDFDSVTPPKPAATSSTAPAPVSMSALRAVLSPSHTIKGRKIGEPRLINTTADEALRGPGVIAAGPQQGKLEVPLGKGKRQKPKLSIAAYRTQPAGVGGATISAPSPSPRSARALPSGITDYSISLASPAAHHAMMVPSPRRMGSFDCAPSPLPTDGRQRHARYAQDDSLPSPAQPRQVVGHRRSASRGSVNARVAAMYTTNNGSSSRQAFYGQHGLNRLSAASGASNGDSFLSIPVSSRYSFDRDHWNGEADDVHGMI